MMRRHVPTLLMTGALAWLFFGTTWPALQERKRVQSDRTRLDQELRWRKQAAVERALWIRGAEEDPYIQERLRAVVERSPALPGPRVLTAPSEESEQGIEAGPEDP